MDPKSDVVPIVPTAIKISRSRFTRNEKSSGAAGESERGLQRKCFHDFIRGLGAVSGCLQQQVRSFHHDQLFLVITKINIVNPTRMK
jgi:hypothetical protein